MPARQPVGDGSGAGGSGVVGVGVATGSGVGVSGVVGSGVGSGVGDGGSGVGEVAGLGAGDDPGGGEPVSAAAGGGFDEVTVVPGVKVPPGVVGDQGVGIPVGPMVERTGTVTTGYPVGAPLPTRPATPAGVSDELGEPVSPTAGSAGPPANIVITVTARSPPPATPSACRALVVRLAVRFRAPWRAAPAAMRAL